MNNVPSAYSPSGVSGQVVMGRFEDLISDLQSWPLSMNDLLARLMVSAEDLRSYCSGFLGASPGYYILQRRLRLVRKELLRTSSAAGSINELATGFGFTDLARFSEDYYDSFGESPLETRMRPRRFGF
jgi:transcriptional regulator GlxA family with amidase domain